MVNRELPTGGPATGAGAFLDDLYTLLSDALVDASGTLAGTAGMGGRVASFTGPYDAAAHELIVAGSDLAGAVAKLRLMVSATFDNYHRAEHLATIGAPAGTTGPPDPPARAPYPLVNGAPSAVGDNGGAPWVWSVLVAIHPGATWPDVNTATTRSAAGAWSALGAAYQQAATYIDCASAELESYRAPELPIACTVLEGLGTQTTLYAEQCSSFASSLSGFAADADSAISTIRSKCHEAEIEAGAGAGIGIVAAAVTFGVGGAAGDAAINSVLAGSIGLTIADLATDFLATVASLCEGFQVMLPIVQTSALAASGILDARTVDASFEALESAVPDEQLALAPGRWQPMTLERLEALEDTTNTHVLKKHVGRTMTQLAERFTGKNKAPFSSTFPDAETALRCINRQLADNAQKIDVWLNSSSDRVRRLDGHAGSPVGIVMDPDGTVTATHHYRVVLVRDQSMSEGFRVDSAYPINGED